jgi:diguanylate cyclase (GGDEF)-like protein
MMAGKLSDAQSMLKLREQDLVETNSRLRTEIAERRSVEEKLSLSNEKLKRQLDDITKLQKRLKEELTRDSLTGLFNRRYLMETIDRELSSALRDDRPLSILLMDIDFFKQVNDNFGHQTGDLVLKTIAGLLQQYSRTGDMACRIGGEEFVLIMPSASLDNGLERAEEFRQRVEEARFRCNGSRPKITISIGVASVPIHGVVAKDVMLAADNALYSAKNAGRNRVMVAEKTQAE